MVSAGEARLLPEWVTAPPSSYSLPAKGLNMQTVWISLSTCNLDKVLSSLCCLFQVLSTFMIKPSGMQDRVEAAKIGLQYKGGGGGGRPTGEDRMQRSRAKTQICSHKSRFRWHPASEQMLALEKWNISICKIQTSKRSSVTPEDSVYIEAPSFSGLCI